MSLPASSNSCSSTSLGGLTNAPSAYRDRVVHRALGAASRTGRRRRPAGRKDGRASAGRIHPQEGPLARLMVTLRATSGP